MIDIHIISDKDCENIVLWNKNKGENFLFQWAGRTVYKYPLTADQMIRRRELSKQIYAIYKDKILIGSIEFCDKNILTLHIARFILAEDVRNKGVGQTILNEIVQSIFETTNYKKITLSVFCFNKAAISCYKKVGFEIEKINKNTVKNWDSYLMSISRI